MTDQGQLPPDWHEKPNTARIYDYWLGGFNNFPADRAAANHLESLVPDTAKRVQSNRQFLQRAVRMLAEQGIDQYLDLGSGLPSVGNIHQIVHEALPQARVVYVDSDPIAVIHSQNLLRTEGVEEQVVAVQFDVRSPQPVLDFARTVLDFSRPVAVLLFAVLHFIVDDDEAVRIVEPFRAACVPDSYLAISHGTVAVAQTEASEFETYYNQTINNLRLRTVAGLKPLFGDWEFVPPGIVPIPAWHPDQTTLFADQPEYAGILGGVARKPA